MEVQGPLASSATPTMTATMASTPGSIDSVVYDLVPTVQVASGLRIRRDESAFENQ
jgi:hypothetical protein